MTSYEEYRRYRAQLADATREYMGETLDRWEATIKERDDLAAELEQLRAWQARAMPIVQAVTTDFEAFNHSNWEDYHVCRFCQTTRRQQHYTHQPDCKVLVARALLAEGEHSQ